MCNSNLEDNPTIGVGWKQQQQASTQIVNAEVMDSIQQQTSTEIVNAEVMDPIQLAKSSTKVQRQEFINAEKMVTQGEKFENAKNRYLQYAKLLNIKPTDYKEQTNIYTREANKLQKQWEEKHSKK